MPLPKRNPDTGPRVKAPAGEETLLLAEAGRPLETLLASGGDRRLALRERDQKNAYGCTPFPRSALLDFGSSTASSISAQAYAKAQVAQAVFWRDACRIGVKRAFDDRMDAARRRLGSHLGTGDAEIVFSPSGTDAQLQALFLVKALLGAPLVTIIVGADQTGSGTAHTARGQHFSDRTALGVAVERARQSPVFRTKSRPSPFHFAMTGGVCAPATRWTKRSDRRRRTPSVGAKKSFFRSWMLQNLAGARQAKPVSTPSPRCGRTMSAWWLTPARCGLAVGHCENISTGDFLCLPPAPNFLQALLSVAPCWFRPHTPAPSMPSPIRRGALAAIPRVLTGHPAGRPCAIPYPGRPNYGQWLRWEATLEEMNAYFAVPASFRHGVLEIFAARVPAMIAETRNLKLLSERGGVAEAGRDDEFGNGTIFSFVPQPGEAALTLERCASVYRAMGQDTVGVAGQRCAAGGAVDRSPDFPDRPACRLAAPAGRRVATQRFGAPCEPVLDQRRRDARRCHGANAGRYCRGHRQARLADRTSRTLRKPARMTPIPLSEDWDAHCTPRHGRDAADPPWLSTAGTCARSGMR